MDRLSSRVLRGLLDFVREVYVLRDLDALAAYLVGALPGLVPSEHTSYVEIDFRARRVVRLSNPSGPGFPGADGVFEALMHENPVLAYQRRTGDGRALRISDFLTQRAFRRTRLYNEFHRPLGGDDRQIAFRLDVCPPLTIGVGLNRARPDFSDRERLIVDMLRPHLTQAHRNAQAITAATKDLALVGRGLDSLDQGIVILGPRGQARLMTTRARRDFREYFGHRALGTDRLPELVQRWVRSQRQESCGEAAFHAHRPLVVEREGRRLVVRLVPDSEGSALLLTQQQHTAPHPALLEELGLSRREAQVLAWVAAGKTNTEIGTILGSRPRTVAKHLQRSFEKLGVETRTAAAALAFGALQDPAAGSRR